MTKYLKSCDLSATRATTIVVTVEGEGEEIAEEDLLVAALLMLG
jgi:hypothetical protein